MIPAFREAQKIAVDVRAACKYLTDRRFDGEIVVVDDGSPDQTADVARGLAAEVPGLRVVAYRPNRGKGYALRTGMAATAGRVVMFADAGLCVPYDDADRGLELLERGADIAIGSRRTAGTAIVQAQPLYRRLGSKMFWLVLRLWFPSIRRIPDTQCGFKLFKGDVARRIYATCVVDRMMIDIDMLCRAMHLGYRIDAFPVHWTNDPDTRFSPLGGSLRNFVDLFRIWRDVTVKGRR